MAKHNTEVIYGIHAIESVLRSRPEQVLQLWVQAGRKDKRIQAVLALAAKQGISLESVSREVLQKKCADGKHQGVVALIRAGRASQPGLNEILARQDLLLLVLDGVQDPHNLGACLRSADASGADAVIVSKNRSPGLTPVVRKVASGAVETTPLIQVSNLARMLQSLKEQGVWIIGTAGDAATSLYDSAANRRMAVVMGSEGKGMRRLTREHCDELIHIPMLGRVESLNVSVATGICLFEYRRKQAAAGGA